MDCHCLYFESCSRSRTGDVIGFENQRAEERREFEIQLHVRQKNMTWTLIDASLLS